MKKRVLVFLVATFAAVMCFGEDFFTTNPVDEKETGDFLTTGTVQAKATDTPVPVPPTHTPEDTAVPTQAPTKPPVKPTPKPTPKPILKPTPKPTAAPVVRPTAVPTAVRPALRPEINITKADISELARNKTADNLFGLLITDRKFTLAIEIENSGNGSAFYSSSKLISGDTSILIHEPDKTLQTILPVSRRELVYSLVILSDYEGDSKLPLKLIVKYSGLEKELPVEVYVDESSPLLVYAAVGIALLLLIILFAAIFRKKENPSKKNYDFNN